MARNAGGGVQGLTSAVCDSKRGRDAHLEAVAYKAVHSKDTLHIFRGIECFNATRL